MDNLNPMLTTYSGGVNQDQAKRKNREVDVRTLRTRSAPLRNPWAEMARLSGAVHKYTERFTKTEQPAQGCTGAVTAKKPNKKRTGFILQLV